MTNKGIFQQLGNAQGQNMNPALYKNTLVNKLREMQSNKVNSDEVIKQGLSEGRINQEQVDLAYNIARNVAKNIFGYSE